MATTIAQAVFQLLVDDDKFRADLRRAQGEFGRFTSGVSSAMRTLGVVAGGAGLTALVKGALDAGDAIAKMATRTGVGIESLQELTYAAKLSGVEMGDLETGMRRLAVVMTEAARGASSEAVDLFNRLGISATNSTGGLKTVDDAIGDIAEAIGKIKSPTEAADLAVKAFGRSGTQLLPLLKEGRSGLDALREEARRLGIVLDAETVKATEAANDEIERMAMALKTDLVRAVAAASPALSGLATLLREAVEGWRQLLNLASPDELASVEELAARIVALRERIARFHDDRVAESAAAGGLTLPPADIGPLEQRLEKLRQLLRERQHAEARAARPSAGSLGGDPLGLALTDQQRDQIIKGYVDAAEASIRAYEDELRELAKLQDDRAADEAKLLEQHNAGVVASIEAEIDAYETGLREIVKLQEERAAEEARLLEQHNAGIVASIEAEIDTYEDGLRAIARIQDESRAAAEKRFDSFFNPINRAIEETVRGVLLGTQTMDQAFANLGRNIALSLVEQGLKAALDAMKDAIREFLQSETVKAFLKFIISALGSSFGGGGTTTTATVPAGAHGLVAMQHGGVVSRPTLALIGEAGPEAVVPLNRLGGGEVNVKVEIINQTNGAVSSQTEQRTGPDGQKLLRIFLRNEMNAAFSDGSVDRALNGSYGLRRRGASR